MYFEEEQTDSYSWHGYTHAQINVWVKFIEILFRSGFSFIDLSVRS